MGSSMSLNKVKVVSFDFMGTLAQVNPSIGSVYANILKKYGVEITPEEAEGRFQAIYTDFKKKQPVRRDAKSSREFWDSIVIRFLEPYKDFNLEICDSLWAAFEDPKNWKLLPWAREVLQCVYEQGYKVCLCSNWDERLYKLIEAFGWKKFTADVFIATEMGYAKPHGQFFKKVQEKLKFKPEQILHVGNDFSEDYLAAKRAGWNAMVVNPQADISVRMLSIRKLPDLVMMLIKSRSANVKYLQEHAIDLVSNLRNLPEELEYRPYLKKTHSVDQAIQVFLNQYGVGKKTIYQTIMENWREVIGSDLAHRCKPYKIINNHDFVLGVANSVVKQELQFNKLGILSRIRRLPGCQHIQNLIFTSN